MAAYSANLLVRSYFYKCASLEDNKFMIAMREDWLEAYKCSFDVRSKFKARDTDMRAGGHAARDSLVKMIQGQMQQGRQ